MTELELEPHSSKAKFRVIFDYSMEIFSVDLKAIGTKQNVETLG